MVHNLGKKVQISTHIKSFELSFADDVDDFIVDDEGNPIKHAKKKRRIPGSVQDS